MGLRESHSLCCTLRLAVVRAIAISRHGRKQEGVTPETLRDPQLPERTVQRERGLQ